MDADAPPPPPPPAGEREPKLAFSFPTTQLATVKLADGLERIMNQYNQRTSRRCSRRATRGSNDEAVELGLQQTSAKVAVRTSMGCGGWARVPWVAVSHPTENAQHGLYLQFLFRADMTGVYLCLGQGTMKLKQAFGSAEAYASRRWARSCARSAGLPGGGGLRPRREDRPAPGSPASPATTRRGASSRGCTSGVPTEATLITDIHSLLDAYSAILDDEAYVAADERLKAARKGGHRRRLAHPEAASARRSLRQGEREGGPTAALDERKKGDDDFDSNDDGGDDDDLLPADGGAEAHVVVGGEAEHEEGRRRGAAEGGDAGGHCAVVLELLGKRQDGFWFAEPVTDEIAGYSDEIETPMDYQTAAEKLAAGAYADGGGNIFGAFARDVRRIYENARTQPAAE